MVQLNQIPGAMMALVLSGMIAAAGALALGGMQTIFVTGVDGCNATNVTGCGSGYPIIGNALGGVLNTTAQFGTIGTVIGVGAILAVVVGAFYIFMGNRGQQGGY